MASNSKLHSKPQPPNKPRGRGGGGRGGAGGGGGRGGREEVHRSEREFHRGDRGGRGRGIGDLTADAHGQPGGWWSKESVSFREAIDRTPVLVRLEEGHRGSEEELSLSAGDVLALAGVTERDAGMSVVMAYHVDLNPEEDGGGQTAACDEPPYRVLLALPLDRIPSLAVCVWEEQEEEEEDLAGGQTAFSRFVATHFAEYDWAQHRDKLLQRMGDNYYINISSITPIPRRLSPRSSDKEVWNPESSRGSTPPPALPPRVARTPLSPPPATVGFDAGVEGGAKSAAHRPPRPPRAAKGSLNRTPSPVTPGDLPPPRPPRRSGRDPPRKEPPARLPGNDQEEEDEEERDTGGFLMPTLAELMSSGALQTDVRPTPEPGVLLPGTVPKDKKKKKLGLITAARMMGKKFYEGVSKTSSKLSLSSQSSLDEGAAAATAGAEVSADDDDDDDDSDKNYDVINESMMDPVFDRTSESSRAGQASDTTQDRKGKGDKSKAARKAPKASAVVIPTVRASPQITGHPTLTSQPTSPSSKQPTSPVYKQPTSPTSKQPTSPTSKRQAEDINEDDDSPTSVSSPLQEMTCSQLCFRLRLCGMPDLAQVCQDNSLDGAFFCALSNDALKKAPFKLGSFEVETKLTMVKTGWVPK